MSDSVITVVSSELADNTSARLYYMFSNLIVWLNRGMELKYNKKIHQKSQVFTWGVLSA